MSLSSTSHVYDPPAEDAVAPSGALHRPREGQEQGCKDGSPIVQDPPAEDAAMHSGGLRRPREDPGPAGSALPTSNVSSLSTLLLSWELSEAFIQRMPSACIAVDLTYVC
jgi:hypothetical protein